MCVSPQCAPAAKAAAGFDTSEALEATDALTVGELRVLLAIAPGLAAEMLGISETTAKTHLQRVFAKTGTCKQTELLRRFMSAAPPGETA